MSVTHGPSEALDWTVVQRVRFAPMADPVGVDDLYTRGEGAGATRSGITVPAMETVSTETYFGGFPSHIWFRAAEVRRVRVSAHLSAPASVRIRATHTDGRIETLSIIESAGNLVHEVPLSDSLAWLWVEITAADADVEISDLHWSARVSAPAAGSCAIALTTYNRVDDCLAVLRALASDSRLLELLGRILVVDQGTERIADAIVGTTVEADLHGRLTLIEQPNLGGSGGFSRGMIEASEGHEQWVILLDDDVRLDPESAVRMISLASASPSPTIVGAHMLSLIEPTVLHSWGEQVDRRAFWWRPVDTRLAPVDLGEVTLTGEPALSAALNVDFNGWWMCLIPTPTVRAIGASLPLFIKWDDAEYGLRAANAGVPTVTLAGAALWHIPWTGKDNGLDWQAYFHVRNRLVVALCHANRGEGRAALLSVFAQDVAHLISMQYGSVRARHLGLRDALRGPDHLAGALPTRRGDAQALLGFAGQLPQAESSRAATPDRAPTRGSSAQAILRAVAHQLRPSPGIDTPPQARIHPGSGRWRDLGVLDVAQLDAASGEGYFLLRRDRREFLRLLRDSVVLSAALAFRWGRLAARYREAVPRIAGATAWRRIFSRGR